MRCGGAQGGKAAAETISEMRESGDYSKAATRLYEQRWMKAFGHDFAYVRHLSPIRRLPVLPTNLLASSHALLNPQLQKALVLASHHAPRQNLGLCCKLPVLFF